MDNKRLEELNRINRRTILISRFTIIMSVLAIVISLATIAKSEEIDLSGSISVLGNIDVKNKDEDPNSHIQYLGLKADSQNVFTHIVSDTTESLTIREAYVKFVYDGLNIHIGKVSVPFGYMDLDDPSTSVFIIYPNKNYRDYGLHLSTQYDILKFEGAYIDHANYSIKSKLLLKDGGEIFSVSYANSQYLNHISINNEFYFSSLLFNFSNVTEWHPDNGNFWTRFVFAPGIFDVLGLTLGYYHLDHIEQSLQDYDLTGDAGTYGLYLDLSTKATVSTEWAFGKSINNPTVKIIAKF